MIRYFEEKHVRNATTLDNLISQAMPLIQKVYLKPKNMAKGTHLNTEPLTMYRWLQHEALEAIQAHRDEEGLHRELSELSDVILISLMRIDQILKEVDE